MKNLWRNLVNRFGNSNNTPVDPEMKATFWRNMVEMSLKTEEDEVDCEHCFEMLDEYIDLLDSGEDPATVLPQIEQHLSVCHCCHVELEAILKAIHSATDPESKPS